MIKAILFYIGNVILFFDNHQISRRLSQITGRPEPELFKTVFDLYLEKGLDIGATPTLEFLEILRDQLEISIDLITLKTIFSDIFTENIRMFYLIRMLKGKIPILAVSNTNESHYEFIEKKFPILKLMDQVVLSYKIRMKKPDPGIYHKAVSYINTSFKECLFIDDQEKNLLPAQKLGMNTHLYRDFTLLIQKLFKLKVLH